MKTKTKKSVKTFEIAQENLDQDVLLSIDISSEAQVNTNIRFLAENNEIYGGEDNHIEVNVMQGKRLRIRHLFDFSGIHPDNLDNAMQHTKISYTLLGQEHEVFPFANNTQADLDSMKRIVSVKVITIK